MRSRVCSAKIKLIFATASRFGRYTWLTQAAPTRASTCLGEITSTPFLKLQAELLSPDGFFVA